MLAIPLFLVVAAIPAAGVDWASVAVPVWLAVVAWGLGTLALGSVVWYWGVRDVQGHQAAPFMGLMPVSALALSYVLLGEAFRWWHLAGMALVLGGIGLVVWDQRAQRAEQADHEHAGGSEEADDERAGDESEDRGSEKGSPARM